ncbi:MAG TPA: PspC domain-containing protein [Candidatus Nanopelagicales bacterium]|nr:PspC domain-containing protein [Candidatus Nanopelagicales bacterium]
MSHAISVPRRAYRARRGRVLGGVARGLSDHLGWNVGWVRAGFVVLGLSGFGLVLYAAYWAWLPLEDAVPGQETGGRDLAGVLGLGALALGVLLLLSANGIDLFSSWLTPIVLVGIGLAVIWRQSDDARRASLLSDVGASARVTTATALRRGGPRVLLGLALVFLGVLAALVGRVDLGASMRGLAAVLLAAAGLALVLLPWGLGWWRDLESERRARIRSEERAEVAAQVHDSVLQTLTLIQRASHDPDEVVRLARTEERALRSWLYAPSGDPDATFVAALEREIADVEASYPCQVDFVHVGDVARDDRVDSLVAAAREAVVNAAKHAGGSVSVYAECTDDQVEVFVRDRGQGFDVDAVPEDRLGLRESVHARMGRVGGSVRVRSAAGEGTEVALTLPVGVRSWT